MWLNPHSRLQSSRFKHNEITTVLHTLATYLVSLTAVCDCSVKKASRLWVSSPTFLKAACVWEWCMFFTAQYQKQPFYFTASCWTWFSRLSDVKRNLYVLSDMKASLCSTDTGLRCCFTVSKPFFFIFKAALAHSATAGSWRLVYYVLHNLSSSPRVLTQLQRQTCATSSCNAFIRSRLPVSKMRNYSCRWLQRKEGFCNAAASSPQPPSDYLSACCRVARLEPSLWVWRAAAVLDEWPTTAVRLPAQSRARQLDL